MEVEKYMIHVGDVLEDSDMCFAHLLEGKEKKETLQEHTKLCQKYWKRMVEQRGLVSIFDNFKNRYLQEISEEGKYLFDVMTVNIVTWHDFGKCNPHFQKDKMKHPWHMDLAPDNAIGSRHSILSAMFYLDYFIERINQLEDKQERTKLKDFAYMYSYVISRHHGNLSDFSEYMNELLGKGSTEIGEKAWEWYQKWKNGETVKLYKHFTGNMENRLEMQTQGQAIGLYAWIRLQFSLLTAADYYATSEFMSGIEVTDFGKFGDIQQMIWQYEDGEVQKKIRNYQREIYPMEPEKLQQVSEINILRTELFSEAEENLKRNKDQSVFYLEAPTGSGKSNTAMNLSFTLMQENSDLRKLFYIYPFNTLVEQNMSILEKTFGNKKEIMSQIAVVNSLVPFKDKKEVEEDRENSKKYQEILLDRQFLNYPFILSTHVMLFRTMFGNAKEDVFGFQQLCHSVIVLDEIQSYKINLWSEMIAFLKEFAELLDIKVIIMSATLPNLEVLTDHKENAVRLLSDCLKYFHHKMFRERVVPKYDLLEEDITLESLAEHVLENKNKKVLIEFIKKASAEEFYRILGERVESVFLMTGDSSIQERKDLIEKIKGLSSVILVATQVIEAGVDIDMDIGFKDISRLDSEEQFMGRINRSGKKDGVVYFFNLDEAKSIYKEDVRGDERVTLMVPEIRTFLETKNFSAFYESDILPVLKKKGEMIDKNNLKEFFSQKVGILNMPEVAEKMKLIDDNTQGIFICFGRKLGDVDSRMLWWEYKELLENTQMNYAEKKVRLHDLRSEMNAFIYQFKNSALVEANEHIGDLYFIENGEEYFDENGVLKRELFSDDTDLFL
jgi:CRISPR-associated endonuclease/helicase Cas3